MSNKKGISLVILVGIICSVLSSFLTVVLLKDNLLGGSSGGNSKEIVVNDDGRSQNIYHAVTEKAMPSVVGITTTTIETNIFAIPTQSEGVGTGVIVDANGYILTNSHVVSDGKAVNVNVLFNDGSTSEGKVLWNDPQLDLAMVKVDKTGLTPAEFGDSDKVRIGDIAIAIGNPLGLEFQKSVTQGIISGLDRTIQTSETNSMTGLMQTDASINPGNSGGPLLNQNGQVIGINTAKANKAEGLGFAIPINTAKTIVEQIIKTGTFDKVALGVKIVDLAVFEASTGTDLEAESGVYIAEVMADTVAQKYGIQVGDVIVKIGETEINTMSDLNKALYQYSTGQKATVTVNRGGKEVAIEVTF